MLDCTALSISDYVYQSYWNCAKCWDMGSRKMWKKWLYFCFRICCHDILSPAIKGSHDFDILLPYSLKSNICIFIVISNIWKIAYSPHNFEYLHLVLVLFCIIHKATMTSPSICDVIVLLHCVRLIDMHVKDKHLWDICIIRKNNKYSYRIWLTSLT